MSTNDTTLLNNFTLTESFNNGVNQTKFDIWALNFVGALYFYYTPLLVCLGSIGNLASVYVFYNSKLRLQSTSQYLTALAISDTGFLVQLLGPWLNTAQITDMYHKTGFCKIFVYISYVTSYFSTWLVVCFTVERAVAVVYPLRRNVMCTMTRARIVIACLALISIGINIPVFQYTLSSPCQISNEYLEHAATFNMIDTAVSFTVPFFLIILLNSIIVVGVCRLERARQQLEQHTGNPRLPGCPRSQQKVTRMLLIVSTVFVVLNLPAYIFRFVAYNLDLSSDNVKGRWTALQQLSWILFHTNYGINFILYCLSGQNFRHALIQAIPWMRRRAQRPVATGRAVFNPAHPNSRSVSFESMEAAGSGGLTPRYARQPKHYIARWTFDNSRQRRNPPPSSVTSISPNGERMDMCELSNL